MIKNPKRWHSRLGLYIFFAGLLLGMFLAGMLTWANLEAAMFYAIPDSSAQALENLRCPILLNRHETGVVSATFANPSDRARRRTVDAYISHGFVVSMREERARFDLEPGAKYTVEWPISPQDAVWGRFILVRLYVQRNLPLPARTGSCGVLVVDLPFGTGAQIAGVTIGASLLLMASGAALWLTSAKSLHQHLRHVDYMTLALAPMVILALVFSAVGGSGGWSGLLLLLTFLLIVSIVTWALS